MIVSDDQHQVIKAETRCVCAQRAGKSVTDVINAAGSDTAAEETKDTFVLSQ